MTRNRLRIALAVLMGVLVLGCMGAVLLRVPLSKVVPVHHTGKVMRITPLDAYTPEARLMVTFEDGFECQGNDDSFAAVREGDTIALKGRPYTAGAPFADPDWWDCKEARLVRLFPKNATSEAVHTPPPATP